MIEHYREIQRRRAAGEIDETGFTLIELLIVIVVLGILAAVVIFALGGVTSQSAVASCQSDAKSVEIAVQAYHDYPGNNGNTWPSNITTDLADVGGGGAYGQFLHSVPTTTNGYTIGLDTTGGPTVEPPVTVTVNGTTTPFDSETQSPETGCFAAQ